MRYVAAWVKAIGYWWFAAIGFVPSLLSLIGVTWLADNVASPMPFAVVSLAILLFGSFMAFRSLYVELGHITDENTPRFKIAATTLPTTYQEGLFLPDVYIVNRHPTRTLNLRFSLQAAGATAAPIRSSVPTTWAGQRPILPNPKDVKAGENHEGFLAFAFPDVADLTPFVINGVTLEVIDEQTPDFQVSISLPTSKSGFQFPEDSR